jgi:hypothetical protein
MTPQERELLQNYLKDFANLNSGPVDAEAQGLIDAATANKPQAAYLLVQQVLVLKLALQEAETKMAELEQRQTAAAGSGSFLNPAALGGTAQASNPNAPGWFRPGPDRSAPALRQAPGAAPVVSDFLRSAAGSAAGVVGGMMIFQALGHLFDHHDTTAADYAHDVAEPSGDTAEISEYVVPAENAATAPGDETPEGSGYDPGFDSWDDPGSDDSSWI